MGCLEERIRRLEGRLDAHAAAAGLTDEMRWQREIQAVVQRLSTEDLRALDEIVSVAIERGSTGPVDLYELVDERGRRALDRFERALADYRKEIR